MKLMNATDSFELSIVGYGKQAANWRDRNRLNCRVSTRWRQQTDTLSAALQTWEVKRLLSGLRLLWNKAVSRIDVTFSEPGLSLEATALPGDKYRLNIQLDHALTPTWHEYPDFPVEMNLTLNRSQLQEAIQDLSGEIATYPER